MNKRSRVEAALQFEAPDRPPVVGGFVRHPAFLSNIAGVTVDEFWDNPKSVAHQAFRTLNVDMIVGLILPDPRSKAGAQVDHKSSHLCSSPEEVRDHVQSLPTPEEIQREFDHDEWYNTFRQSLTDGQAACDDAVWIPNGVGSGCANFDFCGRYGYENYVMALTLYPEDMEKLFAGVAEKARLQNIGVAKAYTDLHHVPLFWTGTDACDNRGPFVDPEIMREIYFPHLAYSLEPLKDAGLNIIWHADGNITPIAQNLIDAGVDGFQGLQETIEIKVSVDELDELDVPNGKKPLFMGSVSTSTTLPFGSPDDVRAEVLRWQEFSRARGGGVFINSSSSVGPEVPAPNLSALFESCSGEKQ